VHLPKPKQAVQKPLKYFLIDWKDRELKRKAWDENLPELAKRLYEGMTINDFFKAVEEVLGAVEIIPHECHEGWMWHTGSTDISIILGWSQDDFNQVFLKVLEISHNKLKPKIRG
jgi:cell wall assembly regulator SMI1